MTCYTMPTLTPVQRQKMDTAVTRLEAMLAAGSVQVTVGANGSVAFKGWTDRENVSDLCAYRKLAAANSPALRKAVMRAEAMSGYKVNARAVASGTHSHDGGRTWHPGH